MSKYAGIGSRETPTEVLGIMVQFAQFMARKSHTLRTGGAAGADSAFMEGVTAGDGSGEVYLPWPSYKSPGCQAIVGSRWGIYTKVDQAALDLAAKFHPAWDRCSRGAKALHARNGYIVLGPNLNAPVNLVVAYTKGGLGGGGTGQALRIAQAYNIPIVDLGKLTEPSDMTAALNAAYKEYCSS